MLTLKETRKVSFEELDSEMQDYVLKLFNCYVVRKQIADNNKELSRQFGLFLRTNNPREYSRCFNQFNSAFVNANLINELNYDEVSFTDYFREMSEDRFNEYLNKAHNSFERKVALMCFSTRPSERIANRAEFSVMLAYANMQRRVLYGMRKYPRNNLSVIIDNAAEEVRKQHINDFGYSINDTQIADKRTDYKSLGKKTAPLWRSMIEFYKKSLQDYECIEMADFVAKNFIFTEEDKERFMRVYEESMTQGKNELELDRMVAQHQAEAQPDYYNVADYDEVFSRSHAYTIFSNAMENGMCYILDGYLTDPIFAEKQADKQKGEN